VSSRTDLNLDVFVTSSLSVRFEILDSSFEGGRIDSNSDRRRVIRQEEATTSCTMSVPAVNNVSDAVSTGGAKKNC